MDRQVVHGLPIWTLTLPATAIRPEWGGITHGNARNARLNRAPASTNNAHVRPSRAQGKNFPLMRPSQPQRPNTQRPTPVACCEVRVRVQPRAAREEVTGWRGEVLLLRVTAPPVEDAANRACQ